MTREEAIKTIRELKRETNDIWYEEVYDMAIEALQAQANLDDVSTAYENGYKQGKFEALSDAPDTNVGKWIPCSERLPKEEGLYPVVINGTEPVLSVKYEKGFAMGYFAPVDEAWEIDGHEELIHELEVLAWFELPPYEENES